MVLEKHQSALAGRIGRDAVVWIRKLWCVKDAATPVPQRRDELPVGYGISRISISVTSLFLKTLLASLALRRSAQ